MCKKTSSFFGVWVIMFFLILLSSQKVLSQEKKYENIDLSIDELQLVEGETVENLVKRLIKLEWDESEKVRAIFYWMANNIEYDYDGLKTGYWKYYPSDYKIAMDTYQKRKGVCSGYSHLFKLMCKQIGIKAEVVDGYSRTEISQAGMPIYESNHTWNVVNIEGEWKLIDVTWANCNKKEGKVNTYYFFTSPSLFVANHLPEETEWQLMERKVTKNEFDTYPYISSEYFDLGFSRNYPKQGLLKSNNGYYELSLEVPCNHSLLVKIYNYDLEKWVKANYSTEKKSDSNVTIKMDLENKGQSLVEISSFNEGQSSFKIYKGILYFTLIYE